MDKVWIFDSRPNKQPYKLALSDFGGMKEVIMSIMVGQSDNVQITPLVEGLSIMEILGLSPQEFATKNGCIVIAGVNRLADECHTSLAARRLELYRRYAVHFTEEAER